MSCYTTKSLSNPSGEKQLTLLAIHSTGCILDLIPRRLPMNSREERSRLLSISGFLVVIVTFCDRENLEKFDAKSDKGFFLGYSSTSKAYRVYNLRTKTVMESSNVLINDEVCSKAHSENTALVQDKPMEVDDSLPIDYVGKYSDQELMVLNDAISVPSSPEPSTPVYETQQAQHGFSPLSQQKGTSTSLVKGPSSRIRLNHPSSNILGSFNDNMRLRSKVLSVITHSCYLSQFEPKKVDEALQDADWVNSMHEELHQFVRNDVWELVPRPKGVNVIGTKWILKSKSDEHGIVIRNKSRLVAQGYTQMEGIDFNETFALVARLESIRILLAIFSHLNFKLYQMDVKSAFLNGMLQKKVFVEQLKGFVDPHRPDDVYKLKRALYGLKQAPRAWYDRLTAYLTKHGFKRGPADTTLFI